MAPIHISGRLYPPGRQATSRTPTSRQTPCALAPSAPDLSSSLQLRAISIRVAAIWRCRLRSLAPSTGVPFDRCSRDSNIAASVQLAPHCQAYLFKPRSPRPTPFSAWSYAHCPLLRLALCSCCVNCILPSAAHHRTLASSRSSTARTTLSTSPPNPAYTMANKSEKFSEKGNQGQSFGQFIWNPSTKEFLGRTGGSWCKYGTHRTVHLSMSNRPPELEH